MNPFMVNQSTNMYGISPITQALAQSMALGLQSYQQARQAKATELANILAMTREREKEERARKWKLEDIEAGRKYKTTERIAGETAEERKIRLRAELKPVKPVKPEETALQKQKRADSYFKEAHKILSKYTDKELPPGEATIIKEWIRKYNEISDNPIVLKEPPLPKLTYKLLEEEYPKYSTTIADGRKNKLSPEETLDKIATEIIKKERAKEMFEGKGLVGLLERIKDRGYEPSSKELSKATRNILTDILAGERGAPTLEFGTPEELSQPVQNWKSVIP